MKFHLAKLEADGRGKETVRSYDESVEMAVFGAGGRVLVRDKLRLAGGASTVILTVN